MKTFYYELNEENRILWIDEVDRLNAIDTEIISPKIKLNSIEDINIWHDKIIDGKIVSYIFENKPVELQPQEELEEIQNWFRENDWIPNKIVTGEWESTDPRWIEYLSERADKRERQDELTFLLGID